MQEMSLEMVKTYFSLMRKTNTLYFYCCNRIEKNMPGGEISSYFNYPWNVNDIHLIDEPCPWHQFYIGAGSNKYNIKGVPVSFVSEYDGPHCGARGTRHRLAPPDRCRAPRPGTFQRRRHRNRRPPGGRDD